ncbi:adenylosuccinate lyase [Urechidicola vernalis]|uniref:Adenylosuccinate lyase n=1 Tax=Urechidicola vernalis TaxID=3075600 RepID=A0ABU2Y0L8_9FLAO|nr:adenylosuccinate lyase [Urechidicola sp. P050]MDT0551703.1 adenylosuccinate lyase [Urechidicola sp. P050]
MTHDELTILLEKKVTASRLHRDSVANSILTDLEAFEPLLQITLDPSSPLSFHAAWVLEYVLDKDLNQLLPYLDFFTANLKHATHESTIRPLAKVCQFLAKSYSGKKNTLTKEVLTNQQIDTIIETGFDWMIAQHKVAVKAYTMTTLFLFGKKRDWVHPELKLILEDSIMYQSPAYKARGRITLELIKKHEKKKLGHN